MKRLLCAAAAVCALSVLSGCGASSGIAVSEAPTDGIPVSEAPTDGIPASEAPIDGIPVSEAPTDGIPASEAPTGGIPASEAPTGGIPASEAPTDDIPASEAPTPSGTDTPQVTQPATAQQMEISEIVMLEPGFSFASFSGDDGFEAFLAGGGASSDTEVVQFLAAELLANVTMNSASFGCSTVAVKSPDGHTLFGRNFDWQRCEALVVTSKPTGGYASISTVNLGFISQAGGSFGRLLTENDVQVLAALYAPLDGMNEKGLAVSVNMIQDMALINQDTDKPDLTTTTAVRLLLNKAASVDEALTLLRQYDLHSSMGMMIHFALADTTGRAVVVEYIDTRMVVTETPVVTNFYLAEGPKQGVGTQQSHTRFDILTQTLAEHPTMSMDDVRDALDSVSKHNFNGFESTEWSAVFDLSTGEAHYYHRENYNNRFTFSVG